MHFKMRSAAHVAITLIAIAHYGLLQYYQTIAGIELPTAIHHVMHYAMLIEKV